jgi:NitT/TauT family transport system substrate-binding protein
MVNRRDFLLGTATVATALAMPNILRAQELKKVRFAYGVSAIGMHALDVAIGSELGFYREEGLELEILSLGQTPLATLALDTGDSEFGVGTLSFHLPLVAKGELPPVINIMEMAYPYKYDVVVPPNSSIASYADLKGKRIGVSTLGVTEYPATRALLKGLGIDPDQDVDWLPVGSGLAGGTAMTQGVVDALASYDATLGTIEGAGIAFTTLPRPEKVPNFGGNFTTVSKRFLAEQPDTAVAFCRALLKSQAFIAANPAGACRAFVAMYPEFIPRGADMASAVASIRPAAERRAALFTPFIANQRHGEMNLAEYEESADFLGLAITQDMSTLFTNDLIDAMNDFDRAAVQQQAAAYPID